MVVAGKTADSLELEKIAMSKETIGGCFPVKLANFTGVCVAIGMGACSVLYIQTLVISNIHHLRDFVLAVYFIIFSIMTICAEINVKSLIRKFTPFQSHFGKGKMILIQHIVKIMRDVVYICWIFIHGRPNLVSNDFFNVNTDRTVEYFLIRFRL